MRYNIIDLLCKLIYWIKGGKMKKINKKLITVLLIVALCVTMAFGLIACAPVNTDDKDQVSDTGKYISNGNFANTSSTEDVSPMSPTNWSSSAGSTASDNETAVDSKSLVSGVVDTNTDVYESTKKHWDRIPNPGAVGSEDSNVLMIYNKVLNSYKYTSNSFSLDSNSYFKIVFSVKTINMTEESHGGYVAINGDTMLEFDNINTNGEWTTYSAFIETSQISSNSLTMVASNGLLGQNDDKLSEGYMFVDNILVTEIESKEFAAANESNQSLKASLLYGDASFENISGSENPYSTRKWSGVSSVGADGETAPTGSDHLERGIVDTNSTTTIPDAAVGVYTATGLDSRFLMIDNKKPTAYGYRSDSKIRFNAASDSYYKLTMKILTKDFEKADTGAYIKITTTTEKDEDPIIMYNNLRSTKDGEWTEFSIYIKPDANRNKDLYLEVGLGTGGKNDKDKLVQGTAFFDEITVTPIKGASADAEYAAASDTQKADLASEVRTTILTDENKAGSYSHIDYKDSGLALADRGSMVNVAANETGWETSKYGAYPGVPYDTIAELLVLNNQISTMTSIRYTGHANVAANHFYRLSMWVKTDIVNKNQGVTVQLYEKADGSILPTPNDEMLTSIDNFNTRNISDSVAGANSGYTELVFLVEGDYFDPSDLYFQFVLGSGTQLSGDTHVKGSAFISGVTMVPMDYADYNSESGDFVKKHSMRESGGSISNNEFDNIDIASTEKNYNLINKGKGPVTDGKPTDIKFDEKDFLDTNPDGLFGLPKSWTFTSSDELDRLNAGIYNIGDPTLINGNPTQIPHTKQTQNLFGANIPADLYAGMSDALKLENRNVLAISNTGEILNDPDENEEGDAWGFTSPSVSLDKNQYYEISVWAYVPKGNASITLKSSSKNELQTFALDEITTGQWTEYKFFVETGFDSFSTYLELAINPNENIDKKSTALFDIPTITKIGEKEYEQGMVDIKDETAFPTMQSITFTTTTFDNTTKSEEDYTLDSPVNWSGSHKDSDSPEGKNKSIAGVFNRDHSNRNWFGGADTDTEDISEAELFEIMNSVPNLNGTGVEGEDNENILVINNHEKSEYTYTTNLGNSLVGESFYEVSLWVRTFNLSEGATASVNLKLHNSNYEFSLNEDKGIKVAHDEWVKYSYYIMTDENADIDDVDLSIQLGDEGEDNYVSGFVFADNITITKMDAEVDGVKMDQDKFNAMFPVADFTEGTYNTEVTKNTHRAHFTEADVKKQPDPAVDDTDPLIWLYITSGILGGLLIITMIVLLFRKFKILERLFPKKDVTAKGKEAYNRDTADTGKSTTSSKDINQKDRE